jgi:hypothetical protein
MISNIFLMKKRLIGIKYYQGTTLENRVEELLLLHKQVIHASLCLLAARKKFSFINFYEEVLEIDHSPDKVD